MKNNRYLCRQEKIMSIIKTETTMRKNFGAKPWTYPQPVLIIGTYIYNLSD